jgi:ribosomal protein S21|tara:strand:- start:1902 stop:2159 length:258 start_codon:yes stop_codon:yes gene_type:complete
MKKGYRKRVKYNDPPGLAVTVENNNVEGAIKRFKRKVKDSRLMLDLQARSHYKKPSELRREKKALGKLRAQKQTREGNKGSGIYF